MINLATMGQTTARICVAPTADAAEHFAAGQLQRYIERISEARLPIQADLAERELPQFVLANLSNPATSPLLPADLAEGLKHDGFRISLRGQTIYIVSLESGGVVHGVFEYLRQCCGCRFSDLAPHGEFVPQREIISHDAIELLDNPACWYRCLQVNASEEPQHLLLPRLDWMAQNGYSHVLIHYQGVEGLGSTDEQTPWGQYRKWLFPALRDRGLKVTLGHHNFSYLVPQDPYLTKQPELFALVDGKRQAAGQLQFCLSNPDLVRTLTDRLITVIDSNPGLDTVALWPDDGVGALCECSACAKLDSPADVAQTNWDLIYGAKDDGDKNIGRHGQRARSRRYLQLCNAVARRLAVSHPKVRLSVIAYVDFVDPPLESFALEPNIVVHLALYWRCSKHRLSDPACIINRQYRNIIMDWLKLIPGDRLLVTTYEAGMGCWKSLPFPIMSLLIDDWRWLKKLGIGGVKSNAFTSHWGAYNLNYVTLGRALREDDPDRDSLLDDFCESLYGAAAAHVREIFDLWERRLRSADAECVTPSPLEYLHAIFDASTIARSRDLCEQARDMLSDSDPACWHVDRLRTLIEYTQINLEAPTKPLLDFLQGRGARQEAADEVEVWLRRDGEFVDRYLNGKLHLFPRNFAERMREQWLMQI